MCITVTVLWKWDYLWYFSNTVKSLYLFKHLIEIWVISWAFLLVSSHMVYYWVFGKGQPPSFLLGNIRRGFFHCKRFVGVCNAKRGKAMIYARVIRDPATSNNIWPWREGSENFSYLEKKKKEKAIFTKCTAVWHSVSKSCENVSFSSHSIKLYLK